MNPILIGVLVLGGLGLVFGVLLVLANMVFEVPSDPKRDEIRNCLPGANCGGCGFAGCDALADAIAAGKAPVNACPVGGAEVAGQIASIMGVEDTHNHVRKIATVICQGTKENCIDKFEYHGIQDCVAASLVNDGYRSCKYACLGLGTCVRACKFDAIHIDPETGIAKVDAEKCQSCGACVKACPRHVLRLEPEKAAVRILCHNPEKGKPVKDNCSKGCIGCGLCMRACKFEAITMVDNLPVIDRDKCKGCKMCAMKCPTGAMWALLKKPAAKPAASAAKPVAKTETAAEAPTAVKTENEQDQLP